MKNKKYRVVINWVMKGVIEVEAPDLYCALIQVNNDRDNNLPNNLNPYKDGKFINDSWSPNKRASETLLKEDYPDEFESKKKLRGKNPSKQNWSWFRLIKLKNKGFEYSKDENGNELPEYNSLNDALIAKEVHKNVEGFDYNHVVAVEETRRIVTD